MADYDTPNHAGLAAGSGTSNEGLEESALQHLNVGIITIAHYMAFEQSQYYFCRSITMMIQPLWYDPSYVDYVLTIEYLPLRGGKWSHVSPIQGRK